MRPRVFLAYKREDDSHHEWVQKLASDLEESRIEVRVDFFKAGLGDNLREYVTQGVSTSNYFLFVSTPKARGIADCKEKKSPNKTWLSYELDVAHAKSLGNSKDFKEVCILRKGRKVPLHFGSHAWLDMRDDSKYQATLSNLVLELISGKPHEQARRELAETAQFELSSIFLEHGFMGHEAKRASDFIGFYDPTPLGFPESLEPARLAYIDEKKNIKRTFDNNDSYSLYDFVVPRPQNESGDRENKYALVFRPTDYFHFVFPNDVLDQRFPRFGMNSTPREILGLPRSPLRLEDLRKYQCHFRVGTGTVFITGDNKIVVGIRSKKTHIGTGSSDQPRYHISVGEGMLRPADESDGKPSPFMTAIRGLSKELNLQADTHYAADDLRCIGILMDMKRAQPVFVFLVRSSKVEFDEVRLRWPFAPDNFENRDILGVDWNLDTAKLLVEGGLHYKDRVMTEQTNQSRSVFALAARHEFGDAFDATQWLTK